MLETSRGSWCGTHLRKEDGDPSPSLGWTPTSGPQLKCGSTVTGFHDPGFFENQKALVALLEKYRLGRFVSPGGYQRVADHLRRETGNTRLDGYALPQIHYSGELRIGATGRASRLLPLIPVEGIGEPTLRTHLCPQILKGTETFYLCGGSAGRGYGTNVPRPLFPAQVC